MTKLPFEHRIIKPFEYTPAAQTDIGSSKAWRDWIAARQKAAAEGTAGQLVVLAPRRVVSQ